MCPFSHTMPTLAAAEGTAPGEPHSHIAHARYTPDPAVPECSLPGTVDPTCVSRWTRPAAAWRVWRGWGGEGKGPGSLVLGTSCVLPSQPRARSLIPDPPPVEHLLNGLFRCWQSLGPGVPQERGPRGHHISVTEVCGCHSGGAEDIHSRCIGVMMGNGWGLGKEVPISLPALPGIRGDFRVFPHSSTHFSRFTFRHVFAHFCMLPKRFRIFSSAAADDQEESCCPPEISGKQGVFATEWLINGVQMDQPSATPRKYGSPPPPLQTSLLFKIL